MKTSLAYTCLFLAASLPAAVAAESVGAQLPVVLESASLFRALVIALIALTVLADYSVSRARRVPVGRSTQPSPHAAQPAKAAHPLAA